MCVGIGSMAVGEWATGVGCLEGEDSFLLTMGCGVRHFRTLCYFGFVSGFGYLEKRRRRWRWIVPLGLFFFPGLFLHISFFILLYHLNFPSHKLFSLLLRMPYYAHA